MSGDEKCGLFFPLKNNHIAGNMMGQRREVVALRSCLIL